MASTGTKVAPSGTVTGSSARFRPPNFASLSSPGCNRRPCRLSLTLI
ncbi:MULTISPECIES: hypothetical protein [Bacteroides]|nr:hypothetical protein [Bacteroides sp.]